MPGTSLALRHGVDNREGPCDLTPVGDQLVEQEPFAEGPEINALRGPLALLLNRSARAGSLEAPWPRQRHGRQRLRST
jgi:hypothetical protein